MCQINFIVFLECVVILFIGKRRYFIEIPLQLLCPTLRVKSAAIKRIFSRAAGPIYTGTCISMVVPVCYILHQLYKEYTMRVTLLTTIILVPASISLCFVFCVYTSIPISGLSVIIA